MPPYLIRGTGKHGNFRVFLFDSVFLGEYTWGYMTRNPFLNAAAATAYITLVAFIMSNGEKLAGRAHNIFAPIAFISLFTLSAAVMGYVFFYQPFVLYFDNKKKAGITLFFRTVAVFAAITLGALLLLFSGVLR